ncbi:MAG: peptidase M13 [Micrococcales bacterium]|nr:peptidase M13 [Micrococcales bacterium]
MAESGIDPTNWNAAIRPQDDLFEHVNGLWLDGFEIPPDRGSDGAFRELHDQAERQVRQIVEELAASAPAEATSHEAKLVASLYKSFMDTDRIEALGLEPIRAELEAIAAAKNHQDMAKILGQLGRDGVGEVIAAYVDTDPGDPQRYVVNLRQSGLGLPDEVYYREDQYEPVRANYQEHLKLMFQLVAAGLSDAAGRLGPVSQVEAGEASERVFALESRLAASHWDVVKDRDATLTYNPMRLTNLKELAPGFPWETWSKAIGGKRLVWDQLVVGEPSFFAALGQAWNEVPLADWQLWAAARVIGARAGLLTDDMVQANFDFYGRVLQGNLVIRDRWKRGVSLVEGALGEAVGRIYTERHFPPEHKNRMVELVANLIQAYRESIMTLDWLGEATKQKALAKLEAFTPKIGYPDQWRDYSALSLDPTDLVGNARAAARFETARELAKIGQPVDRSEWFMTPQTVNAYYNPGMNEIVFPAAILQPPFFSMQADSAANYGGIGAVIGHEIGHGFDDQGSKYDGEGRLVDWWTAEDRAAFERRTAVLIDQFNAYSLEVPSGTMHVNGAFTIGENIGDLGGLAIAWKAYQLSLAGDEPPVIDGLTAGQRFFIGWAQCWRAKHRPQTVELRLATDPHSPERFRCNGASRNLDAFYEAFAVTPVDDMFLPPGERVTIW